MSMESGVRQGHPLHFSYRFMFELSATAGDLECQP
jgi:hypothetical protein